MAGPSHKMKSFGKYLPEKEKLLVFASAPKNLRNPKNDAREAFEGATRSRFKLRSVAFQVNCSIPVLLSPIVSSIEKPARLLFKESQTLLKQIEESQG